MRSRSARERYFTVTQPACKPCAARQSSGEPAAARPAHTPGNAHQVVCVVQGGARAAARAREAAALQHDAVEERQREHDAPAARARRARRALRVRPRRVQLHQPPPQALRPRPGRRGGAPLQAWHAARTSVHRARPCHQLLLADMRLPLWRAPAAGARRPWRTGAAGAPAAARRARPSATGGSPGAAARRPGARPGPRARAGRRAPGGSWPAAPSGPRAPRPPPAPAPPRPARACPESAGPKVRVGSARPQR